MNTTQSNTIREQVLEEMKLRRTRNDNINKYLPLKVLILVVTVSILVLHPFILYMVDMYALDTVPCLASELPVQCQARLGNSWEVIYYPLTDTAQGER